MTLSALLLAVVLSTFGGGGRSVVAYDIVGGSPTLTAQSNDIAGGSPTVTAPSSGGQTDDIVGGSPTH